MMGLLYKAGKNTLNQFCDIVKKNKDNGGDVYKRQHTNNFLLECHN